MKTSFRIPAILLGLLGVERILYADILTVLPGMAEPSPVVNIAMGLGILVVATGLFLGFGWSRWPAAIGAALIMLQGIAYVAWGLARGHGPAGVIVGLFEPVLAAYIIERLVRHWPLRVRWNERLR